MLDGSITTKKVPCVKMPNEKELAQKAYDEALTAMIANPNRDTIEAFGKANARLFEVEDAYRIALKLLAERARNLLNSAFGLNRAP